MKALIAKLEAQLGMSWSDIMDWLRAQNGLDEIEQRLTTGNLDVVVSDLQEAALKFAAETHDAYVAAGKATAEWLDKQLPDSLVRFDVTNHAAVARAQANQLELVSGLADEQRTSIQQVLSDGAAAGTNPRAMARDIRDSIGLTPNQEAAVRSYRNALENGDWSNALGRELSGGHSDRTIVTARDKGAPLSQDQIDLAVERYRGNQLTWRSENIARTEASRHVHQGNDDAFAQAIANGDVEADQLEGEWVPGPKTKNARPDHRAQSLLSQRPTHGETFDMPDGTRMKHPGDPAGGAANCASCRCTKSTRLVA